MGKRSNRPGLGKPVSAYELMARPRDLNQPADHHPGPRLLGMPHLEASQKTALDHTPKGSKTSCIMGGNHRRRFLRSAPQAGHRCDGLSSRVGARMNPEPVSSALYRSMLKNAARVFDRAASGCGHVPHRQRLGHDHAVRRGQPRRNLVHEVLPPSRNLCVSPREVALVLAQRASGNPKPVVGDHGDGNESCVAHARFCDAPG